MFERCQKWGQLFKNIAAIHGAGTNEFRSGMVRFKEAAARLVISSADNGRPLCRIRFAASLMRPPAPHW